jgi:hypothetical protein
MAERCKTYHAIDLAWLERQEMLKPGGRSSIKWTYAYGAAVSVGVVSSSDCVQFTYRHGTGHTVEQAREVISFTHTRTCFGGRRRWFACPQCSKACRVLFGVPFRCRMCRGLHYSSQYQSAGARAANRLVSLRARLGGSADLLAPFPARPRHMRHKTYGRLRALNLMLVGRFSSGIADDLERLGRRIGSRHSMTASKAANPRGRIMLSSADVIRHDTDVAVLADGLRLVQHWHAIAFGVRHAAVSAGSAWLVTGMAEEIAHDPAVNPDGLSRLQIARWLLAMTDMQLIAIDQMDAVERGRLGQLLISREIAAPPGVCWSQAGVTRASPPQATRKQRRRSSNTRLV